MGGCQAKPLDLQPPAEIAEIEYYPVCQCGEAWTRQCRKLKEDHEFTQKTTEGRKHAITKYTRVSETPRCSCGNAVAECDEYDKFSKGHTWDKTTFKSSGSRISLADYKQLRKGSEMKKLGL
jgi:hypothetical protein